ncbi:MAG: bifunctional phosphoribosylaminoimidazolecarboxamide formyltransferase/IMP cyclohydrolase [Thermogutta sp.]|nr:bifunctional phosphoribosylaminoimidazolecarboxamide formyltransferase/IMP cyclohydrolase [Thermogutta sp.]
MPDPKIQRALVSVSNKLGLAPFARGLVDAGVEIFSTGGTRAFLEQEGIPVRDVASYTGFPEMMDGRIKTLHPKVFGGILCRHDHAEDIQALETHGILSFELVVVNLYPFQAAVARPDCTEGEAIEKIDIGGPSLVRAAAKNHAFVTIATDPGQYADILVQVQERGATTPETRRRLAAAAFAHTADYDRAIAAWFARKTQQAEEELPARIDLRADRLSALRYGENPHQKAGVYVFPGFSGAGVVTARQLHGKELSYNNLLDLDSGLEIARFFTSPAAVVIKHNNPCGAAVAQTLAEAAKNALAGDPLSAYGSILGFNRPVDVETAEVLCGEGLFVEAIAAPAYDPAALTILTERPKWRKNVRLLEVGEIEGRREGWAFRVLAGGLLLQQADTLPDDESDWKAVTQSPLPDDLMDDLRFAWSMVRFVKSNAIVLAKNRMLVGVGAGQMSRVDSTEIAIRKAADRASGSVLASDAFFPFPDSIERAAAAGVRAIIQPGGSIRDQEVIDACNRRGLPMIFTGRRHFKH